MLFACNTTMIYFVEQFSVNHSKPPQGENRTRNRLKLKEIRIQKKNMTCLNKFVFGLDQTFFCSPYKFLITHVVHYFNATNIHLTTLSEYFLHLFFCQGGYYRTLTTPGMTMKKNLLWRFVVPVDSLQWQEVITGYGCLIGVQGKVLGMNQR